LADDNSAVPPAQPRGLNRLSPELRTAAYYLVIFASGGAANGFGGIWFASQGITPAEIGIINAAPVAVMLVMNLVVGRLADRAGDWRTVIMTGSILTGIFPLGLFFFGGFPGALVFWTLTAVAQQSVVPVADAAVMRITRRRGSDFGSIRAWGTIGYIFVIFASGYVIGWAGIGIFLPLFAGLSMLRGLFSLGLPKFRAHLGETPSRTGANRLRAAMKPAFLLPLTGAAVIYATVGILNGFQGLLWKQQGLSDGVIGALIALGAVSEAAMFFGFRRLATRFSPPVLIFVSGLTAVFRWVAFGFSPGIALLVPLQLLHSTSYALGFLGGVNLVANATSEDIASEAQSFFVFLQQLVSVIALTVFGSLAEAYGAHAYFASAVFAGFGCLLVVAGMRFTKAAA
jgi:PPP family 3-phenylpropionic acid transporter